MRKIISLGVLGVISCAAIFYLAADLGRHPESLLANGWGITHKVAVECNLINRLGKAVTAWTAKPTTPAGEEPGQKEKDAACIPNEPQPVDALLPDPAKLTADWQPSETIDLLRLQQTSNVAKQENADKEPSCDLVSENASPEGFVPAASVRSADEAECFPLMPYCESLERLPVMPYADSNVESELDHARVSATLKPDYGYRGYSHSAGDKDSACSDSFPSEEQEDELTEPMADRKAIEERLMRALQSYLQERKWPGRANVDTTEFRPCDAKKGEFDRIPF